MSNLVALEVSADTIRAAEISKPFSKDPRLVKVGELVLPKHTAGESIVMAQGKFSALLKELWQKEKFKTKNVALVVGGREFLVRRHTTTYPSMKSLRPMLQYDTAKVFPEKMSDPVLDFYPTNRISSDDEDMPETGGLVIAAQTGPIENIVNAISDAGLHIEFVDYAPMAVARFVMNHVNPTGDYIIANVREETTDILVSNEGIPASIRVVAKGLEPKRQLALLDEEDEEEEQASDLDLSAFSDAFSQEAEEDPITSLSRDIQRTAESVIVSQPEILYLTGNRSLGSELARTLEELLEIEVDALFPQALDLMKDKKNRDSVDHEVLASSFVAVCAGMRGKK